MKNGELSTKSQELIQRAGSLCPPCCQTGSKFEQERPMIHAEISANSWIRLKMADKQVELKMSKKPVSQLKDKLKAVKEKFQLS